MPQATPTAARKQLTDQIDTLVSGHDVRDIAWACADVLAAAVGLLSEDQDHAAQILSAVLVEQEHFIAVNWPALRQRRERCFLASAAGNG